MPITLSRSPSMAGKRECGLQHQRQPFFDRLGDVDDVHLRARNHDVAGGQVGHLEHAFDHRQGVGVDQVAFVGVVQNFEQFRAVLGLGEISAVSRSNSDLWGLASVLTLLECSCIAGVSRCFEEA
jgi:hypothetical protein